MHWYLKAERYSKAIFPEKLHAGEKSNIYQLNQVSIKNGR